MLFDLDTEPTVPTDFDVCIAGAGAAGITLALELLDSGARVCLLEAGGREASNRSQDPYQGQCDPPLADGYLAGSRLRYLGGTTNHWVGAWLPLDPIDFEPRPWVPGSGWPFGRSELDPYYRRAAKRFGLEAPALEPTWIQGATDGIESTSLEAKPWVLEPIRFGRDYSAALEAASDVALFLNANLVHVGLEANGGRIARFEVASYGGRRHSIRARHYVLALGALENARLLLCSNDVQREGVGNGEDLVGRFFMEHPVLPVGEISGTERLNERAAAALRHDNLRLSDDVQRRHRLLNCHLAVGLVPQVEDIRRQLLGDVAWQRLEPFLRGHQPDTAPRPALPPTTLHHLPAFSFRPEAPPLDVSRLTIDETRRDAFGLPRAHLSWRLHPEVRRTTLETGRLIGIELGRLGIGRLRVDTRALEAFVLSPGFHHMGTTRMHEDERRGVVDPGCRVHGIENLHLAGSSVFPTCGAANPTYTLIALAVRLADGIKRALGLATQDGE